jgi:hypothetical protein
VAGQPVEAVRVAEGGLDREGEDEQHEAVGRRRAAGVLALVLVLAATGLTALALSLACGALGVAGPVRVAEGGLDREGEDEQHEAVGRVRQGGHREGRTVRLNREGDSAPRRRAAGVLALVLVLAATGLTALALAEGGLDREGEDEQHEAVGRVRQGGHREGRTVGRDGGRPWPAAA